MRNIGLLGLLLMLTAFIPTIDPANSVASLPVEDEETYNLLPDEWWNWDKQLKDSIFPTLGEDQWWLEE